MTEEKKEKKEKDWSGRIYVRGWLVQRRHTGAFCTENLCNLLGFEVKVRTAGEPDIFYIYILSIFTVLLF